MAVALIALLILLCSGAQAAPQRQKSANVLEYLTSRDDTLVFRGLLARWAKVVTRLALSCSSTAAIVWLLSLPALGSAPFAPFPAAIPTP